MTGKHLIKRPDTISLVVVVGHLLMVVSPVYLAAVVGPGWQTVGFWLFFGLSMNGVLNLMHECSHFHVFKERWGQRSLESG